MKILILTLILATFTITLPAEIPDWEVITGTSYSMVLMAQIYLNEEKFTGTGDNLAGAFGPGGETDCRSLAAWQPDNPPHYEGFWYFTIVGNLEDEEITFKIYATAFDSVFSCNQSIEFHNDTTLGTPTDPYQLSTTAIIAAPSNFRIGITDSGQTELTWNNLGLFYRIYKSSDPYADFPDDWILLDSLLAQGVFIDTVISSKSFYRITAGTIPERQEN